MYSNRNQHTYTYIPSLLYFLVIQLITALGRVPCTVDNIPTIDVFKIHKILHYITTEQSDG